MPTLLSFMSTVLAEGDAMSGALRGALIGGILGGIGGLIYAMIKRKPKQ